MNSIKAIISSLFIYSYQNDKSINQSLNKDDKTKDNSFKDLHQEKDQHRKQNFKLPLINLLNQKPNNNQLYITKNLLLLKEQEARIKVLKQAKEKPKTREYPNKAYLHISSRLLERKQQDQELIRKVMDRYSKSSNQRNKAGQNNKVRNKSQRVTQSNELPQRTLIPLDLHKDYGRIPEYLIKKKEENKEQKEYEKLRNKEKLIPKGMRRVPEQERLDKIKELTEMKRDLEEELSQMPIARISMKKLQRKGEIEELLRVIDIEHSQYSLKTVIIPIDL